MADTHYLSLAYLAEIAVIFNLAYYELKWKNEFKNLSNKRAHWAVLSTSSAPESICQKRKCKKCGDHSKNIFDSPDYNFNLISEIGDALHSDPFVELPVSRRSYIFIAWSVASCKYMKYLLFIFHMVAKKRIDRGLSLFSLGITIIILLIMTMADNRIDFYNLLDKLGLWNSVNVWTNLLLFILMCFIITPSIFWIFWHKFIDEYECLSILLAEAYQRKRPAAAKLDNNL